jgi:hypothetical protein
LCPELIGDGYVYVEIASVSVERIVDADQT